MPLEGWKEGKFLLDPRVSHVFWFIFNEMGNPWGFGSLHLSFVGVHSLIVSS